MNPEKITILLADDDDDDREFFREAIEHLNIECHLIMLNNGEKVIDFFKKSEKAPEFIFLDINMPRVNGIECLKFIKKRYPLDNFHIIMLSTAMGVNVVEQSYLYGASVYVQKPSKFNELSRYIYYCINELKMPGMREEFILNNRLKFH